ncbi:hypothetical protein N7508_001936 [Penicillium antarcticum]|uniref:uncharacterized protein n=1 Tax=Penicillium antarcticum TaxID=416450 RepID=UPI00238B95BC|nr:uncharacterized protein N7508_001936 [Penicillium antarcticum]KAJ5317428.1 hypothetical protein N7508_001936 [Penicillium antarcticum]
MFNPTPLWVWRYDHNEFLIEYLLRNLEGGKSRPIQPFPSKDHVSLHKMDFVTGAIDFVTGATSSSMVQYFKPNRRTEFQIRNTSLDPKNPKDDMYLSMLEKKNSPSFDSQRLHQQLRKSFSKYITHSPNGRTAVDGWQFINPQEGGDLYNSNDKHGFIIDQGAASVSASASHQIVIMNSEECHNINTPSTGEIIVLLRWMLAAVKPQKNKSKLDSRKYAENCLFQHDIPAISFDDTQYEENMDSLLQWAWPIVCQDTSKPIPMQTIEESDETDQSDES